MSDATPLARPYARAIFSLAQSGGSGAWSEHVGRGDERAGTLSLASKSRMSDELLQSWQDQLDLLAAIAADSDLSALANNPRISGAQLQSVILDVGGKNLSAQAGNLVKLLVHHRRIHILPAIAAAYSKLCADALRVVSADVITAAEIDAARQKQFAQTLQNTFGQKVELAFQTDAAIIGGAVIRAGDVVIDGSVRASLQQLAATLGVTSGDASAAT